MKPARLAISIDGRSVEVEAGRSLGSVLHRMYDGAFRRTALGAAPRGLFCGMGVCFDCLVTVDGRTGVRACMTPVASGMIVETGTR